MKLLKQEMGTVDSKKKKKKGKISTSDVAWLPDITSDLQDM